MTSFRFRSFAFLLLAVLGTAGPGSAQSADKIKLDVLSALSTPLPITVIGPIMTRDVTVTPEGDGFRATLENATLMGIFPIGDISLDLAPLDGDTYRISNLTLPQSLDFPGFASLDYSALELEGTWSASRRSYSDLRFAIRDLNVLPGEGAQGAVKLGEIAFDVAKEPDDTDTESLFEITATDVSVLEMMPDNLSVGEVRAVLSANGDQPVDLYSVIRELIMVSGIRNGGSELESLGRSLLGNTYGIVSLELAASDLDMADRAEPDAAFLRAGGLEISTTLTDVEPRAWGGADIAVTLRSVSQTGKLQDGTLSVDDAVIRLTGGELPVADMFEAFSTLESAGRGRPVKMSTILDGIAEFGRLGFSTQGRGVSIEVLDSIPPAPGETTWKTVRLFETGYDSWAATLDLAGLNRNRGEITFGADFEGGRFAPGDGFAEADLPHVEAWFPLELRLHSSLSNLNEAFLKKLFTDVDIQNLNEPVELLLPLALYASATVFETSTGQDVYETGLFRITQSGAFKLYPTELLSLLPYEGRAQVRMTGIDRLSGYFNRIDLEEATAALTVLRNLARESEAGTYEWDIARPDVDRTEFVINGITMRIPDFLENLPLLMGTFLARL